MPVVLSLLITIYITDGHLMSEGCIIVSPKVFQILSSTAGKCTDNVLFCFVLTSPFQFTSHDMAHISTP